MSSTSRGGRVDPTLGLSTLIFDAGLLGLAELFVDALLEVELDEVAVFADEFS